MSLALVHRKAGRRLCRAGCRRVYATAGASKSAEPLWLPRAQASEHAQHAANAIARRPVLVAMLSCGAKAYAADLLVQAFIERKEKLDHKRSLLFLSFGGLFQGGFQYFIWNVVFERLWPGRSGLASLCKLAATNFISDPFFFFPTFYCMKEALCGGFRLDTARAALRRYRQNMSQDLAMSWSFWIPGHYVTYFMLPLHLRVPWAAFASFGYVCVLSYIRAP